MMPPPPSSIHIGTDIVIILSSRYHPSARVIVIAICAQATSTRNYTEQDARLEYLAWRTWGMKQRRQQVSSIAWGGGVLTSLCCYDGMLSVHHGLQRRSRWEGGCESGHDTGVTHAGVE